MIRSLFFFWCTAAVLGCETTALFAETASGAAQPTSKGDVRFIPKMDGPDSSPSAAAKGVSSVLIDGVPHIRQKEDFCGEACVAMVLRKLGKPVDQDWVFDHSGLSPALGRGVYTRELVTALSGIGFEPVRPYRSARTTAEIRGELNAMVSDLTEGVPSVVCMRYSDEPRTTEHFRLVLGYDDTTKEVIYHEPAELSGAYKRMPRERFEKLWPLGPEKRPVVIRLPLRPGVLKEGAAAAGNTNADFAQHVMKLKRDLPRGLRIAVEPPFVVIGNQSQAIVNRHARGTIRSTVKRLKKDYFTRDPEEIIDVWLFGDGPSYRRYARELFGHTPDTPFGYYTEEHNALVMNVGTGAGTLVHELVHPFMRANFPDVPPWFNEGLASLYEGSTTRDGSLWGLVNWRLPGLQKEIRGKRLPPFEALMAKDEDAFYGDGQGDNYAQSRYLLLYMQEKGLLKDYYHAFFAARRTDPSGFETLKSVLGVDDMDAFQKRWQRWVMRLEWRR